VKDWKTAIKVAIWSFGVGRIFQSVVSRKDAFERHFKRAPVSVMLFPTNLCNALCSFCAYPTNTDKKQMMPNAIAFKAIDDFIAMGGRDIINFTTNLGDPLIDPRLGDKLAYAKSKGVKFTSFYTNGILLDRDGLIEKIAPYTDMIRISLPGLDRQNYLDVFKVDKAEKVTRGLIKLAEYKKKTGHPKQIALELRISRPLSVVMADEGMVKIKPYIDAGIFIFEAPPIEKFDNWGGTISEADMVGDMKMLERTPAKKSVPCAQLFQLPGVLPDGHVRACSCWYVSTNYDKLTLESVTEKPLSDILFGDQHRKIMADWMQGDLPPPCPKCSNYSPAIFSLRDIIGMASAALSSPQHHP
jgi:hypothetical protein